MDDPVRVFYIGSIVNLHCELVMGVRRLGNIDSLLFADFGDFVKTPSGTLGLPPTFIRFS